MDSHLYETLNDVASTAGEKDGDRVLIDGEAKEGKHPAPSTSSHISSPHAACRIPHRIPHAASRIP
ncbi:hypothetical protein VC83_00813 [Pseudogymnoascus destructans]|uniref:Uncharacterized protein n=1 Tax=Pseudogymnoascus destructans TaxID=655981 RepID=A0A177AND6_9PEZI|nr:uncharacterized protein VC83_00813 [Pseudogymnoascus destructans]OAF62684.1 hypothetical protein VC83_00813 [Pseudogymnoascus destructans]